MRRQRILYLTSLYPNPVQPMRGLYNQARVQALREKGCRVRVIAPVGLTPPFHIFRRPLEFPGALTAFFRTLRAIPAEEKHGDPEVFHPRWAWLPRRLSWPAEVRALHFWAGRTLKRLALEFRPTAVISSWLHPWGTYAAYLRSSLRVPWLAWAEGSDLLLYPHKYRGWHKIEKLLRENVDAVVLVSEALNRKAQEITSLPRLVIPNGFNRELFSFAEGPPPGPPFELAAVGNLSPVKGFDILLEAMKILGNGYRLTLVGDGQERTRLETIAAEAQLQVNFTGALAPDKLPEILKRAHLFCLPSRSESFGIAALEALGCGTPVVASRVGGLPEIIIQGKNGFLFTPGNARELAHNINLAVTRTWDRPFISKNAHERFSWSNWADRVLTKLTELA